MRTDADRALAGDYGVVRMFARELLQTMPDAALAAARPKLALLAHAIPELLALAPDVIPQEMASDLLRPQLQPALREWLLMLSQQRPLVMAIDDFQRIDEPSATLFALLALDVSAHAIALIVSIETGTTAVSDAVCKLFIEGASNVTLGNLIADDTELLLRSLFGDTPHVDVLAHRLHGLAAGNPRDVMRLAQHLVDAGRVRYRAGAWTLPSQLNEADLPPSIQLAQRARIETLGQSARELASALALCPDLSFSLQECGLLSGRGGDCSAELDELLKAEVAREVQDDVALAKEAWGSVLRATLGPEEQSRLHARLAEVLATRQNQPFRVGQHLLLAGELDRGLDILIANASVSQENTAQNEELFFKYVQSLPADWLSVFTQAIRLCDERGRPPGHKFSLLSRLAGIVAMLAIDDKLHMQQLLDHLKRYSGLDDWAALDPTMEPMPRLVKALEQAQARYNQTPEHERVLDPLAAIRHLARALLSTTALAAMSLEVSEVRGLPSLVPLVPLSPALGVLDLLIQGMCARYTARFERGRLLYKQLLERVAQPDRAGLDASHSGYLRKGVMNGVGMIEAGLGLASCLDYAQQLEQDPTHCMNALQIRMLYELWQGNVVEADRHRRDVDRVRIQNSAKHWFEGSHLLWEVTAYALSEDLTRIKHAIEEIAPLALRYPAWVPVARYAAAQYERVRGDHGSALAEVEAGLAITSPRDHQTWIHLATTHLQVLMGLDRGAEALELGQRYVASAEQAELGYAREYLRMTLAVVQAKQGQREAALASADQVLAAFSALGATGLNLGLAYEARARVAMLSEEMADFARYAAHCRQVFCGRKNRALIAKYERLLHDAKRAVSPHGLEGGASPSSHILTSVTIASALRTCRSATERAAVALTLLKEQSGAEAGYLFSVDDTGPRCIASSGDSEPSDTIISMVRAYVALELEEADTTATDASEAQSNATAWVGADGQKYRTVLLSHQLGGSLVITGVAVLVTSLGRPFVFPAQIASTLSKFSSDAGDHSVMVTH
jgi:tetratricopeptide (TPR) repeat protein